MFSHLLWLFVSMLLMVAQTNGECHECDGCINNPCYDHSIPTSIKLMWQASEESHNFSLEVKNLKCEIFTMLSGEITDKRLLAYLVSVSLWSLDHFSGMPTTIHPTCVFSNLVNQTIIDALSDNDCEETNMKTVLKAYGNMCFSGIDNTLYTSMKAAGCPIKIPKVNMSVPCVIGTAPQMILEDSTFTIPDSFKPLLLELLQTPEPDNIAVAAAAFGASTKSSVDFFESQLDNDVFVKLVQLKACPVRLPGKCCSLLRKELDYLFDMEKAVVKTMLLS